MRNGSRRFKVADRAYDLSETRIKKGSECMKKQKTNAMRILESNKIPYIEHEYEHRKDDPRGRDAL